MGIVIRQSFWSSGLVYLGVAIGYINTLILLPYFMDMDQVGLVRLIQSNGMLLLPVAVLGMNGVYLKYYPQFKGDNELKIRIFSFQVTVILAASILFTLLLFIGQDWIKSIFEEKSTNYNNYLYASLLILTSQALFNHLISVVWSEFNITIPNLLNEIILRLLVLSCIVCFGIGMIPFHIFVVCVVFSYLLVTIILFLHIIIKYKFKFDWRFYQLSQPWIKKHLNFGSYTTLITTASSVTMNISYLITASIVGLEANGILTISIFISTIIELPKRVVTQIVSPFITQNFNDKKLHLIDHDYKRSSVNLSIISLLLAIGIITNLSDLYALIPQGEKLSQGFNVIIVLTSARILNMLGSISTEVLTYSKYYRLNIFIAVATALLMIGLNLWLIPLFGILGAGISILISTIFTNISRMIILYQKFRFSPFTVSHIYLAIISVIMYLIIENIPFQLSSLYNIIIRSVITTILFVAACYVSKISFEINNIIDKAIGIITKNRRS